MTSIQHTSFKLPYSLRFNVTGSRKCCVLMFLMYYYELSNLIPLKSFVLNNNCNRDKISTQREGFHYLPLNNLQTVKRALEKVRKFTVLIMLYVHVNMVTRWQINNLKESALYDTAALMLVFTHEDHSTEHNFTSCIVEGFA